MATWFGGNKLGAFLSVSRKNEGQDRKEPQFECKFGVTITWPIAFDTVILACPFVDCQFEVYNVKMQIIRLS